MKNIIFFNHWHYGDLFSTRGLVIDIRRQLFDRNFAYIHTKNPAAVADLAPTLEPAQCQNILNVINMGQRLGKGEDAFFVNTWVGAYAGLWPNAHPSYLSHYKIFEECYRNMNEFFGTNLILNPDVWAYVPDIDYSVYDTKTVDLFIDSQKTTHLFCNGAVQSTQSSMGNMKEIIETLAVKHPEDTFVATEAFDTTLPNIKFTNDIFNKPCDICEISYLSIKTNVVVGKNSGPFTYANTRRNLMNPNKHLICFSHKPEDTLPYGLDFPADFVFSDTIDNDEAVNIIEKAINE